jgi:acyl-CoA thioester hydrolase
MKTECEIKVRYSEVDRMGIVYYSRYLEYFEIGRANWLEHFLCNYKEMEDVYKIGLPVIECGITYKKSAKYEDEVLLKTICNISELPKFITFNYELFKGRNLLVTGFSKHLFYCFESKKVIRLPAQLSQKLIFE